MLKNELEIPEGIEVRMENDRIFVRGPKGELSKAFKYPHIKKKIEGRKIILISDTERKKIKAIMRTWKALIDNMITGATKGWRAELKLVYSHFPVKLRTEEGKLLIENFLGERNPRIVPIPKDLELKVDKNLIFVSGADKERVGQLSARIEQATNVKGYDKRVFQDGCYITKKPYLMEEGNEGRVVEA
jgi:large subunit ribosomal protein L6